MRLHTNMLIDENAYGAPWNDQFYRVTLQNENGTYKDIMCLSGPKNYSEDELFDAACGYFNDVVLKVEPYEIRR